MFEKIACSFQQNAWDCLNFADRLLTWLMKNTVEGKSYVVSYQRPFVDVSLEQIEM
jgi:hypothetical protein